MCELVVGVLLLVVFGFERVERVVHVGFLGKYLMDHGAQGVVSCVEYQGGTLEKTRQRIADPDDDLTEDNCHHICAAAFGTFQKKTLTVPLEAVHGHKNNSITRINIGEPIIVM